MDDYEVDGEKMILKRRIDRRVEYKVVKAGVMLIFTLINDGKDC